MLSNVLKASFHVEDDLNTIFEKKLESVGLSKTHFERLSGIQRKSLDGILNKTSKHTDVVNLLKLGQFLDLSLEELMILHFKDRPSEEIKDLEASIAITFINKHFDLKILSGLGFVNINDSIDDLQERICSFFGLESVFDYDQELGSILYSKSRRSYSDKMRDFWIKSSYRYFEAINNPNEYSRKDLLELIPKIKPYTRNVKDGLLTVFQALFNIGVTVIFQPSLPKTHVRGATFVVNGKPCIVITDWNKNYATIWFALIHELHHVLFDLEIIETTKFHLTGEPDLFLLQEEKANEFAGEYLLSTDRMRYIEKLINNPLIVERFAKENQIHPCIVYSQYQWRQSESGKNYWGYFKEHFPDVTSATKDLNIANWDVATIKESAEKLKQLLTV